MRVLVVDDDAAARQGLAAVLAEGGHSVATAPTSARAIRELERARYDVMFTDLRIGRESGIELLADVRERWPRLTVVILTATASVETAVRTLRLGASDYLSKPVQPEQVRRVLDFVHRQRTLSRAAARPLDPVRYARALASEGGYEVLLISPPPAPPSRPRVHHLPLDPDNPVGIRDAVEEFVAPRGRAAVVIGAVERLLAHHREEEIAALLDRIRSLLEGKGPLAVGYDPDRITASGAFTVRAAIVAADAHSTIESLASPIRRLVLRRLADGPSTFMQAMNAAHLDDTSKIAFHLRKLTESELVAHVARERYALTARGRGAVRILDSIDDLDSGKGSGNRVFPSASSRDRDPSSRGRKSG